MVLRCARFARVKTPPLTYVLVGSSPRSYLLISATVRIPVHTALYIKRYKVSKLNARLSEVLLLRLRATFHTLPPFYLRT